MHSWHVAPGAEFENVGQWKRPWYCPRPGEDMDAAVLRECAAAGNAMAVLDWLEEWLQTEWPHLAVRCTSVTEQWAALSPTASRQPPVPMLGRVTSGYRSAALGRTFALALVRGGRERIGQVLHVPLGDRDLTVEVTGSCSTTRGACRDGRQPA